MIKRIIAFSADNKYLVLLAVVALVVLAVHTLKVIRLDALPDLSDTQVIIYSRWDRSPDIMEDQVTYPIVSCAARSAEGQGGARPLGLRLLLRLRHLSGRDRHLLGAVARPGVPVEDPAATPRWRANGTGPGRERGRVGLPVRAGGPQRNPFARRAAVLPGLDAAVRDSIGAGSLRSGVDRRVPEAVPGHRRPQPPRRLQHPARRGGEGGSQLEQRGRRPPAGMGRDRVHGPRPRLREEHRRISSKRSSRSPTRAYPFCCATWPGSKPARRSDAASPTWTDSETMSAGSSSCATGKTRSTSSTG